MLAAPKTFLAFALALCLASASAFAAAKARSTSTSRQFLVYGADVRVRGAMCELAERTKSNLLQLLGQRDGWKTPLIVNLDYPRANFPDAPVAQLDFSQLGYGLKLQLNLLLTSDMKGRPVQRELLRAILVEMIYRNRANIAAGTPYVTPPDWLVEGVLALEPGRDSDDDAELLRTIVASKTIAPLEEIVRQKRAPARRALAPAALAPTPGRWCSCSSTLPAATPSWRGFIQDLPDAPNDRMADLRAHFPEHAGTRSRQMVGPERGRTFRHRPLPDAERGGNRDPARPGAALFHSGEGRDGARILVRRIQRRFRKLAGPAAKRSGRSASSFQLLGAQAHPSYRAIVQEAYELTELLARGKTRGIAPRLARLRATAR